jgi:hypothetical protein
MKEQVEKRRSKIKKKKKKKRKELVISRPIHTLSNGNFPIDIFQME